MHETTAPAGAGNGGVEGQRDASVRGLYRHPSDRVLAGVCGGVADRLGWDATVVRLLWVVLAFATSGAGFVVYLLLALLLPVGTQETGAVGRARIDTRLGAGKPLALILIGLGVLWLLNNLGILPGLSHVFFGALRLFFWPVLLIVIGWQILRALGVQMGNGETLRQQATAWGEQVASWGEGVRESVQDTTRQPEPVGNNPANGLWRSRNDRVLLGVCGGIAERYALDPVLVRLLWAMVTLATLGLGLLAYLLTALLLPVRDETRDEANGAVGQPVDPNVVEEIKIDPHGPVAF